MLVGLFVRSLNVYILVLDVHLGSNWKCFSLSFSLSLSLTGGRT